MLGTFLGVGIGVVMYIIFGVVLMFYGCSVGVVWV